MIDHPYKVQIEGQRRLEQLLGDAERAQGIPKLRLRRRAAHLMRTLAEYLEAEHLEAERLEPEPPRAMSYGNGRVG